MLRCERSEPRSTRGAPQDDDPGSAGDDSLVFLFTLSGQGKARYIKVMTIAPHGGSLEVRRKQLLFRCQRRGFKEVDLIFGTFAAREIGELDDKGLDELEALLHQPDQDVFAWLKGEIPVPAEFETPVFSRLKALCSRKDPTWNV
jgi:antitoxin CptB